MRQAMRDGMTRHMANQGDAGEWAQLNRQYSNYKTMQKAGATAGSNEGYISSGNARNIAAGKHTDLYLEGDSDVGRIASAAQEITKAMPNSGTAPIQLMMGGGGAAAGMAAGAKAGAALSPVLGPVGPAVGGAAGAVLPAIVSTALASRPGQAYFGNQLAQRLGIGGPRQAADYITSMPAVASQLSDRGPAPVELPPIHVRGQ
jgi:hypothetical protein